MEVSSMSDKKSGRYVPRPPDRSKETALGREERIKTTRDLADTHPPMERPKPKPKPEDKGG